MSTAHQANLTEAEIEAALGNAMLQWATIEQRLFYWFQRLTGLSDRMARAIFYSARSFKGRAEMLEGAISASDLPAPEIEFIKSGLDKAIKYNSFRNRLVHGEVAYVADNNGRWQAVLADGKHPLDKQAFSVIEAGLLSTATANFRQLSKLLMDALYHVLGRQPEPEASPERCREQVEALPNQADSATPSRKQQGRQRQREADRRRARK